MRPAKNHRPLLLQAAARLFARKPFHQVLMDEVADGAGVAKGTVYRFFKTKEDLYAAVCLESLDELARRLEDAARQPDPPLVHLERMAGLIVGYFHARRDFFNVLQREWGLAQPNHREAFLARRTATRSLFVRVIREGQRDGAVREVNAELAADGLLGIIRSFVRFGDPRLTPEELTAHLLDLLLNGIAASARRGKESTCLRP